MLLKSRALTDCPDASGLTPLDIATSMGSSNAIEVLSDPGIIFWNKAQRASSLYKKGEHAVAFAEYEQVLQLAPKLNPPSSKNNLATLYFNCSRCAFKLGKHLKALEHCTHALELRPSYFKVLHQRAECHLPLCRREHTPLPRRPLLGRDRGGDGARCRCRRRR